MKKRTKILFGALVFCASIGIGVNEIYAAPERSEDTPLGSFNDCSSSRGFACTSAYRKNCEIGVSYKLKKEGSDYGKERVVACGGDNKN